MVLNNPGSQSSFLANISALLLPSNDEGKHRSLELAGILIGISPAQDFIGDLTSNGSHVCSLEYGVLGSKVNCFKVSSPSIVSSWFAAPRK